MQLGRTRLCRALCVDDHVERLPDDVDQLECVFGERARLGDDGRDPGSGEGHPLGLERTWRDDEVLGPRRLPGARERIQVLEVAPREHPDDSRQRGRPARVDAADAGMRVRRPEDRHVRHPRQLEIVEVLCGAGEEPRVLDALDRRADEPLGHRLLGLRGHPRLAASTARTMFS